MNGVITKLSSLRDKSIDDQIMHIVRGLNLFPFLGILSSDPDTTGWGATEISWWVNISTPTVIAIKLWNGSAVITVGTSSLGDITVTSITVGANILDANEWAVLDGIHAAWTAFTPTWGNITVGNGTNIGAYKQVGKIVVGYAQLTAGNATIFAAGNLSLAPPVSKNANCTPLSYLRGLDNSAGNLAYEGVWLGGALRFFKVNGNYITEEVATNLLPFAWTTNDAIYVVFQYKAA